MLFAIPFRRMFITHFMSYQVRYKLQHHLIVTQFFLQKVVVLGWSRKPQ